uniref:Uncharacterized protein n=1 Tax=Anguilla anguilla TaxID=7936 RepID=A0A0E9S6W1_ANGAN
MSTRGESLSLHCIHACVCVCVRVYLSTYLCGLGFHLAQLLRVIFPAEANLHTLFLVSHRNSLLFAQPPLGDKCEHSNHI